MTMPFDKFRQCSEHGMDEVITGVDCQQIDIQLLFRGVFAHSIKWAQRFWVQSQCQRFRGSRVHWVNCPPHLNPAAGRRCERCSMFDELIEIVLWQNWGF
jgi:hypothetical protein